MTLSCTAPGRDCGLCPRLHAFRQENRERFPDMFNAPVPSFGEADPLVLLVGLAPGLRGANFTGRPFTNDYAGDLLYPTLLKSGLAAGAYGRHAGDGLALLHTRITNAVRCVPPENKPTPDEMRRCLPFLEAELESFRRLRVIVALGTVAHNSVLRALGLRLSSCRFGHGAVHQLWPKKSLSYPVTMIDSYHCSRYNVNTGRLTADMFETVIETAREKAGLARRAA